MENMNGQLPFGEQMPPLTNETAPFTEIPPSVPPVEVKNDEHKALSTVAASPVLPKIKQQIVRERGKSSLIFSLLSGFLIAMMVLTGIYSMPDGSYSESSFQMIIIALILSVGWMIGAASFEKKAKMSAFYDSGRINEIYPQGAVSVSAKGRMVLPFEKVTRFVEAEHWVALFGEDTEVVWSACDLTPAEAGTLFTALATYLPEPVLLRKKVFCPAKPYETPLPPPFVFEPVTETIRASVSPKNAVSRGFFAILRKAMPLFLVVSAIMANVLCDNFDMFRGYPLIGRLCFTALSCFVCLTITALLVAMEQTKRIRLRNRSGVQVKVSATSVRVEEGADFTVIPKSELKLTIDDKKSLYFPVGEQLAMIPYAEYAHTSMQSIFNS